MEASTMDLHLTSDFLFNASSTTAQVVCEDMNVYLWNSRRDLTTRPLIMGVFASLYSTIIILSLVGNACVLVAISRIRSLQTVPNMFIFSLSCSDMLVCCISATITPIAAFRKDWIFGQFLCSFAPFLAGVSLCFSTFVLAAISVDRFLLILFPTRKAFSHTQALFIILTTCLLASVFSLPMLFMQKLKPVAHYCGRFCFEDWGEMYGIRRLYGTMMLTVQFIIPLALITFCYTAISFRLGKSVNLRVKKRHEWKLPISSQQNAATKRRQRTNRMFIAMVIAFSLSWIWSVLYNLLRDYDCLPNFVRNQEFFFGVLTHSIAMTSTVWNPILYALLNLQLRAAFLHLVPKCMFKCTCRSSSKRIGGRSTFDQGQKKENEHENKTYFRCLIGPRSNESSASVSIEGKKEKTKHMMHNDDVGNNYHQQRLEKELMNDVYNESCYTEEEQTLIANLRIHFEDMNVIDNDNDTLGERDTDDRI